MKILVFVCGFAAALLVSAGESRTKTVTLDPSASLLWKTAPSGPVQVSLLWPKGAVSALLTIDGAPVAITDTKLTSCTLEYAAPADAEAEKVVDMTLEYKDSAGSTLQRQTARVGFVCGISRECEISYRTVGSRNGTKSAARRPVIKVPSTVSALTLNSSKIDVADAPTWVRLDADGSGRTLVWTENSTTGSLEYTVPCGIRIILK